MRKLKEVERKVRDPNRVIFLSDIDLLEEMGSNLLEDARARAARTETTILPENGVYRTPSITESQAERKSKPQEGYETNTTSWI